MATKKQKNPQQARWIRIEDGLREELPHLTSWLGKVDDFAQLLIKAKLDGTCLAVAKGYGPDGGPVVCFGSGYGFVPCLMALDATIQGGYWREVKPWGEKT